MGGIGLLFIHNIMAKAAYYPLYFRSIYLGLALSPISAFEQCYLLDSLPRHRSRSLCSLGYEYVWDGIIIATQFHYYYPSGDNMIL